MAKIMNREQFQKMTGIKNIEIGDIKYQLGREIKVDDYFKFNAIMYEHLSDKELNDMMNVNDETLLPIGKLMKVEEEKIKFIIEVLSRGCDDGEKELIAENVISNQKDALSEFERITKNLSREEYNKIIKEQKNKKINKSPDLKN